jgi:hypothetical protein
MYLFTRSGRLAAGNLAQSQAWAINITEKVNHIAEFDVSLWTRVFSAGVGTLTWTAVVEQLAELEDGNAKLMVDSGFASLSDEGAKYLTVDGLDDTLAQIISPVAPPSPSAPTPNYANVVQAVVVPGQNVRGIELGLEIAEAATKATGMLTIFTASQTGPWGQVSWVGTCETVQQLQQAQQALAVDPALTQLIVGEASQVYQPGAEQVCYQRIV